VVAGTRFLLTRDSRAHSEYLRRILNVDKTLRTMLFGAIAPTMEMPESAVDRTGCYAGQSALRMNSVTSARQALAELSPGGH
jgi:hypothetical protein